MGAFNFPALRCYLQDSQQARHPHTPPTFAIMQHDGDMPSNYSGETSALILTTRVAGVGEPLRILVDASLRTKLELQRVPRPLAVPTPSTRPSSYSSASEFATSSATASNLPGPGRAIGILYSFLGKRLEKWVSAWADSHGYGPNAIARRIDEGAAKLPCEGCTKKRAELVNGLKRDCRRLLQFSQ